MILLLAAALASPFPTLSGSDLEGAQHALPGELRGNPAIAIVSFTRPDDAVLDPWMALVADLEVRVAGLDHRMVAMMGDAPGPVLYMVQKAMKFGTPSAHERQRTVLVTGDSAPLRARLGLSATEDLAGVLIDENGQVSVVHPGAPTQATRSALTQALGLENP